MSLNDRLKSRQNLKPSFKNQYEQVNQPQKKIDEAVKEIVNLGILDNLLKDDVISSIYVNGAKNIFVEKRNKFSKSTAAFRDNVQIENLIRKQAQNIGITLDESAPFISFNHELGVNVTATLPPLTTYPSIHVKCYRDKFAELNILEEEQSISKEISLFIENLLSKKTNIIIAGKKGTLKTTLLSAMAKKAEINNRCVNVDYLNEYKIDKQNYINYDFSKVKDAKKEKEILNITFNSNPDKIFINSCSNNALSTINENILNGFKGAIINITASSKEEAIEKIITEIIKNNPSFSYNYAKILAYKAFDYIIFVKNDELGKRKIETISELYVEEDLEFFLNDIFNTDATGKHLSTGYIPVEFIKENERNAINLTMFNSDYIHTYQQNEASIQLENKNLNIEILKKFKKDLSDFNKENPQTTEDNQEEEEILEELREEKEKEKQEERQELKIKDIEETTETSREDIQSIRPKTLKEAMQLKIEKRAQELKEEVKKEIQEIQEEQENSKYKVIENEIVIADEEAFMKKAQQKFEEIKKNSKLQKNIDLKKTAEENFNDLNNEQNL